MLIPRRSPTLHDFPYRGPGRKCYHKWIVNVTPPGRPHCIHACLYCYARDAIYSRSHAPGMEVYANLGEIVEGELSGLELCPPVSLSNVTDPCQDVPELRKVVKEVVGVLVRWGVSFHLITKGDPSFLGEVEGFPGKGHFFLAVTIEGPPEVLEILSPAAPPYSSRLQAISWAASRPLPVMVRMDPVIPPLWKVLYGGDWERRLLRVLEDCARAGAKHVVSSTGRFTAATRDELVKRLAALSPSQAAALREDYPYDRSQTSCGYMLKREERVAFHRFARKAAQKWGMTYAACQELPAEEADTTGLPHCEAFPMPFSRRTGPEEFSPIEGCTANCHVSCAGLTSPPCGRPELARAQPFSPSVLKKRDRTRKLFGD